MEGHDEQKFIDGLAEAILFESYQPSELAPHGIEFFFSNVLIKVMQLPMMFASTCEVDRNHYEGSFVITIFEKVERKRAPARKASVLHKQRMEKKKSMKLEGKKLEEERMWERNYKVRRLSEYLLRLYDTKSV